MHEWAIRPPSSCSPVNRSSSWPSSRKSHLKSTPCPLLLTPTFAVFSHRVHTLPLTKRSQPLVLTVPLPSSSLTLCFSKSLHLLLRDRFRIRPPTTIESSRLIGYRRSAPGSVHRPSQRTAGSRLARQQCVHSPDSQNQRLGTLIALRETRLHSKPRQDERLLRRRR